MHALSIAHEAPFDPNTMQPTITQTIRGTILVPLIRIDVASIHDRNTASYDGNLDLATARGDTSEVIPVFNNGNGSFGKSSHYAGGSWGWSLHSIVTSDFDLDGRPDLAVLDGTSVTILRNTCLP